MFWETRKSEKENDEIAAKVVQIVEDLGNPRLLYRFLLICIAGNTLIWLFSLIVPDYIYLVFSEILHDEIGMIILGFPFGLGLFTTYCLLRLKFPDVEDNKILESEMMASFTYQSDSTRRWFIWLISILAGVFNVLLLIVAVMIRQ